MTATHKLNDAKRELMEKLGENVEEYFRHMKNWFRKRCTKEEFDIEARKLLPLECSHYHNEFLFAILNKCQTLASFPSITTTPGSSVSPTKAASPGAGMSPSTAHGNSTSIGGIRTADFGDGGRLKYGPVKKKSKSSRLSFDQRFQPAQLCNGLSVPDAGSMELREDDERKLAYAYKEPTLPDISLLHGRMMVSAWEAGLEIGVDDEAVNVMVVAVEQFLRNIITALLMDKSGYRMRDNRLPFCIGNDALNPWLMNTQKRYKGPKYEVVSEIFQTNESFGNENELISLVPAGERMLKDVEHEALLEVSCATNFGEEPRKRPGPVNLFNLMHTLQKNKKLIPSHSVYSLNIERLISRLYHPGHDD